jgi:hypothetical protein
VASDSSLIRQQILPPKACSMVPAQAMASQAKPAARVRSHQANIEIDASKSSQYFVSFSALPVCASAGVAPAPHAHANMVPFSPTAVKQLAQVEVSSLL